MKLPFPRISSRSALLSLAFCLAGVLPAFAQTAPVITAQPQSQSVNLRATAAPFSVTASGSTPLFYQWFFNGQLIKGATTSSLALGSVTDVMAGDYTVSVSNSAGGVLSNVATLTVVQVPEILGPPPPTGYTGGIPYRYAITATNSPSSYSATGLPAGLSVNPATGVIAGTISGPSSVAGTYQVTLSAANSAGTSGSVIFPLQVNVAPGTFSFLAGGPLLGSADGTGAKAQFGDARWLALDSGGNSYVTDTTNHTIRKITPAGVVTTIAGLAGQSGSADGTGPIARFNSPTGIAVDSSGNLYVCDTGNQLIRKITAAGVVSTIAGVYGQIGSNDGPGTSARFNSPQGIAVDSAGNVFVADTANNTVRQITPAGTVTTLAGSTGQSGTADGSGSVARFSAPTAIATNPGGNVFVLDSANYSVRKITPAGAVTTVAQQLFFTDVNPFVGQNPTHGPNSMTVDGADNLFLTYGPYAPVFRQSSFIIQKISAGGPVSTLYQWSISTFNTGNLPSGTPYGLAADSTGKVYVANGNIIYIFGQIGGPTILTQPQNITATSGQIANFAVTVGGLFPATLTPKYQWQVDGANIPAATNPTATTSTLSVAVGVNNAVYSVIVSTDYGAVASNGATLTVNLPPGAAPVIRSQPQSVTVNASGTTALNVTPTDSAAIGYQWYRNGVALPGANSATLLLSNVTTATAGNYTVTLARVGGSVTSAAATVSVTSGQPSRISNLSVRTNLASGQNLIVGFVTSGAKNMLLRAVGPGLNTVFGLTNFYADPSFSVVSSAGATIDQNNDWLSGLSPTFASVGAFPLVPGSKDAALARIITGANTALVSGIGSGVMLVELYDAEPLGSGASLTNVSARNQVGTGGDILISGFVIDGTAARTVLIRGIGPGLHDYFGVNGVLPDPVLEIHQTVNGQDTIVASNDNWDPSLAPVFAQVGAYPFAAGSKDAALVVTLPPGIYTAQVSGVNSTTGDGVVEVYVVP